jgi:peptidyl-prolyl cis-trans isomerase A (cyclophilin A)
MHRRTVLTGLAALSATPVLSATGAWAQGAAPGVVKVELNTAEGLIVLELAGDKAPLTVANFLKYLDGGRYTGGTFYRGVTVPGAPQLGLVQFGPKPGKYFAPVPHEPTSQTGLKHLAGTVSLARGAPNSGTCDIFICIGDAPYLDADPSKPGDNLGFAAFGQVVEGMDVAKRIQLLPKSTTAQNPTMVGQMLEKPVPILTAKRA